MNDIHYAVEAGTGIDNFSYSCPITTTMPMFACEYNVQLCRSDMSGNVDDTDSASLLADKSVKLSRGVLPGSNAPSLISKTEGET